MRGLEERAAARERAAVELQRLADGRHGAAGIRGLVQHQLQLGAERMLAEQLEFLKQADALKKQAAGVAQGRLL